VTDDEPLEGDIGPAAKPASAPASASTSASEQDEAARKAAAAEKIRRYEEERQASRERINAASARIAQVIVAVLLAFLAYDSFAMAVRAHDRGDPWLYPPATIGVLCLVGLVTLFLWTRRRRR
jgi:protein-S-isoprenylcysteine O-methyltransferase Ste14